MAARDEPAVDALRKALNDPSVEVRIVAAEALCRIDREEAAVPVLVDALTHKSQWVRLQAANSLDRIGEKARPAIGAIRRAAEDPSRENMFIRWVMAHTLKQLLRENNEGND
jgi:HEAT repeat protein